MAKTLQFRRGTTSELSTITGAVGELFVDTTKDTVVVMDGSTAGGFPLASESALVSGLASKADAAALSSKADSSALTSGLASKQNTLVSGTSIKTINNQSLLGSGNISISGGSGGSTDLTQVSTDITPLFDSVYDIGSTDNRFYDAYLGNKLDINGVTVSGTATLVSAGVTGVPGSTTTQSTTVTFDNFSNGQVYVMGSSLYVSETNANNGWAAWANAHWNTSQLNGATITCTSLDGTEAPFTTTITGFFGSAPYYGFALQNSQPYGTHIIRVSITYNATVVVPAIAEVPAVYDYSLASNATLVAPSLAVDTSLIGGLYTEGTTITPEHILGSYSDTKGTLTVDGALTVNESVVTLKSLVLDTGLVEVATVLTSVAVPETTTDVVADFSTSTVSRIEFLSTPPGYPAATGYLRFYFSDVNAANTPVQSLRGQTIKFSSGGYTWTLTGINGGWNEGSSFLLYYDTSTVNSGPYPAPINYSTNYGPGYNSYTISTQLVIKAKHSFTLSTPVTFNSTDVLYTNGVVVIMKTATHGDQAVSGSSITLSNNTYTIFDEWQSGVTVSNLPVGSKLYVYKPGVKSLQYKRKDGSLASLISVDTNTDSITISGTAVEKRSSNIASGTAITTGATYGIALGEQATISSYGNTAIGVGASALAINSVAIGNNCRSNKYSTVTIGYNLPNTAMDGMTRVKNFMQYTVYGRGIYQGDTNAYLGIEEGSNPLQLSQLATNQTAFMIDLNKINSYESDNNYTGYNAFVIKATMIAQNSYTYESEFYAVRDISVFVRKNTSGWSLTNISNTSVLDTAGNSGANAEFLIWNNSYLVVRGTAAAAYRTNIVVDAQIRALGRKLQ